MTNSSFASVQFAAPPRAGQSRPPAGPVLSPVSNEERDLAAQAGRILLAWHSPYLTDAQITGIGLDSNRVCRALMMDQPPWLEYVWDQLVVVLGGLAGEAVACGSVRRSAADDCRERCRETAGLLARTAGARCPWPDYLMPADRNDGAGRASAGAADGTSAVMNAALRRAKLLLLRDRFCFEALRRALAIKPVLTDAELIEVIGPRPQTP